MKQEHLVRQKNNLGAILNTDNEGKKAYEIRRAKARQNSERIDILEEKVDEIGNTLSQILELLKKDKE